MVGLDLSVGFQKRFEGKFWRVSSRTNFYIRMVDMDQKEYLALCLIFKISRRWRVVDDYFFNFLVETKDIQRLCSMLFCFLEMHLDPPEYNMEFLARLVGSPFGSLSKPNLNHPIHTWNLEHMILYQLRFGD